MPDRCQATAKSGKPCSVTALPGDQLCAWHSPVMEERRRQWSRRGGHQRSNKARARRALPPAMTPAELEQVLGGTLRGLLAGRFAPNVASAAAALGRTLITIREAGELETRLSELEAAAGFRDPGKTA